MALIRSTALSIVIGSKGIPSNATGSAASSEAIDLKKDAMATFRAGAPAASAADGSEICDREEVGDVTSSIPSIDTAQSEPAKGSRPHYEACAG
jgi:hypothetical protein